VHAFTDLSTAAYCPRKLYYRWRDGDHETPELVRRRRDLAFRYPDLLDPATDLAAEPIEATPTQVRSRLGAARERLDRWADLADPAARDVLLEGKDCRGVAHKVLDDPPVPSVVSAGAPPEQGVWEPQSVRAVAAAKALAWERQRPVERAYVEYPAHGVVRRVRLTTRRKAAYRRALRTVEAMDGPPPRQSGPKCDACEYRSECGVRTRSLRSLL
jgi:CRISPR-associated exonuclease Cas4